MNLRIFIHGLDMFSLSAMKGILEPEKENGVSIFNVDVEIIKSLSTETNPCETNPKMYPDYMRGAAIAERMTEFLNCVTPYVKGQNAICITEEKAKQTL